jgi:uncharacterized protein YbcV (DUF1398 family)
MTTAIENLHSAQARAMSIRPKAGGFPVLAKVLHLAGVHRNEWFLPAAQSVYVADFDAREVTYYGWNGESYLESYPDTPTEQS